MKNKLLLIFLILTFSVFSCSWNKKRRLKVNISHIKVNDIKIKRYGEALFKINNDSLKEQLQLLKKDYSFFLDANLNDTLNLIQIRDYINDPILINIYRDCIKKYPKLDDLEHQLTTAFKYYKYYFPNKKIPQVYTYISGLDYQHNIIFADSVLVIALDMYMGKDYEQYRQIGIPEYKVLWLNKKSIVRDCMEEIASSKINYKDSNTTFLNQIIKRGKILYFLDAMLPDMPDEQKIEYTKKQLEWCKKNESNIWAFFIENKLLYSTDYQAINKFIIDGPFTSVFSRESPSRIGCWIGWQIVRAFMNNNKNTTLNELINEKDAQKILSKSKYKPKNNFNK